MARPVLLVEDNPSDIALARRAFEKHGIDGFELPRRIRADPEMRRIPVVVLFSSTEEVDVAAAYDLGADSYLRKPIDFTGFIDQVNRIRLYWLFVNVPPHG